MKIILVFVQNPALKIRILSQKGPIRHIASKYSVGQSAPTAFKAPEVNSPPAPDKPLVWPDNYV